MPKQLPMCPYFINVCSEAGELVEIADFVRDDSISIFYCFMIDRKHKLISSSFMVRCDVGCVDLYTVPSKGV